MARPIDNILFLITYLTIRQHQYDAKCEKNRYGIDYVALIQKISVSKKINKNRACFLFGSNKTVNLNVFSNPFQPYYHILTKRNLLALSELQYILNESPRDKFRLNYSTQSINRSKPRQLFFRCDFLLFYSFDDKNKSLCYAKVSLVSLKGRKKTYLSYYLRDLLKFQLLRLQKLDVPVRSLKKCG